MTIKVFVHCSLLGLFSGDQIFVKRKDHYYQIPTKCRTKWRRHVKYSCSFGFGICTLSVNQLEQSFANIPSSDFVYLRWLLILSKTKYVRKTKTYHDPKTYNMHGNHELSKNPTINLKAYSCGTFDKPACANVKTPQPISINANQ